LLASVLSTIYGMSRFLAFDHAVPYAKNNFPPHSPTFKMWLNTTAPPGAGNSLLLIIVTWEDWGLRPALANSSWDSISKIIRTKLTEGVAQVVECLLCKCKVLSSNPSSAHTHTRIFN
jgi:hypothetical protein